MVNRKRKCVFIATIFLITFVFMYMLRMGAKYPINSDETTCYDMAEDFFNGNITLRGWFFSTGLFLLPSTVMYFFVKIFGNTDFALYFLSSFNWAFIITISVYCIWKTAVDKYQKKWMNLIFPITAFLILIVPRATIAFNSGTHILCVATSILCFCLLNKVQIIAYKELRIALTVMLVTIMGILSATNTMFMYCALIPMVLCGVVYLYLKEYYIGLYYILSVTGSYIVQTGFKLLWETARGEKVAIASETTFVSAEDLWKSISIGIINGVKMFGIDPWGHELASLATVESIVGGVLFLKVIKEIYCYCVKKDKGKESPLFFFFLFMGIINICSYMFSTMAIVHSESVHLIFPFLFGITTSGVIAWIHNNEYEKIYVPLSYLILALVLLVSMHPKLSIRRPVDAKKDVANYLIENGFSNGYGGAWASSSIPYFAEGITGDRTIVIAPIMVGGLGRVQGEPWLTKKNILDQNAFYFVCYDWELTSEEMIVASFGQWDEKLEFEDLNLYIWSNPISTYGVMGNANYCDTMSVTDDSMRIDNGVIQIPEGQRIFGPYLSLSEGDYALVVNAKCRKTIPVSIVGEYGSKQILFEELKDGFNIIHFSIVDYTTEIEFLFDGVPNEVAEIQEIYVGSTRNEQFNIFLRSLKVN